MPTGYTSDIYEGKDITFRDFALQCARAFGALIEMRDHPMDAPIPDEFKPSDYHQRKLTDARNVLAAAQGWSDEVAERLAHEDYMARNRAWTDRRDAALEREVRYNAMLAKVEAWQPPTEQHVELKSFMVQQITESMKFDCSMTYDEEPLPLTGDEYRRATMARALKDIDYHTEQYAQDVERAEQRTRWVKALRESLEGVNAG